MIPMSSPNMKINIHPRVTETKDNPFDVILVEDLAKYKYLAIMLLRFSLAKAIRMPTVSMYISSFTKGCQQVDSLRRNREKERVRVRADREKDN